MARNPLRQIFLDMRNTLSTEDDRRHGILINPIHVARLNTLAGKKRSLWLVRSPVFERLAGDWDAVRSCNVMRRSLEWQGAKMVISHHQVRQNWYANSDDVKRYPQMGWKEGHNRAKDDMDAIRWHHMNYAHQPIWCLFRSQEFPFTAPRHPTDKVVWVDPREGISDANIAEASRIMEAQVA